MNLRPTIEAINARLAERGAAAFVDGQTPVLLLGEEHVADNGSWPRFVAYPTTDTFSEPQRIGATSRPSSEGNPKQIKWRHEIIEVELWCSDYDAIEDAIEVIVEAAHKLMHPYVQWLGGEHDRETLHAQHGRKYVLRFAPTFPVTGVSQNTVAVEPVPPVVPGEEPPPLPPGQTDTGVLLTYQGSTDEPIQVEIGSEE